MKYPMKRHLDIWIIGSMLCVGLFLWMGNRSSSPSDPSPIKSYGGDLPGRIQTPLEGLNEDLNNVCHIVTARPGGILFITDHGKEKQYRYAYETLWVNDLPVISNIKAFHFEYRDKRGNLLIRAQKNPTAIVSVAYTMRIEIREREILINSRVKIPSSRIRHNNEEHRVAWASPSYRSFNPTEVNH